MKDTGPFKLFTGQQSHKELVGLLEKEETRRISVNGLFGSSKSVVMADTFNEGINVVVMDNKEEAQFITNDLYNIMEEDCVFFFPCSSNISQSKIIVAAGRGIGQKKNMKRRQTDLLQLLTTQLSWAS